MANQMNYRRATRTRLFRRHGTNDINNESEHMTTDSAAQWLARHGGPPLPKNWKQVRKRKKERRKLEAKPDKPRVK